MLIDKSIDCLNPKKQMASLAGLKRPIYSSLYGKNKKRPARTGLLS
jgi:hypothetical protein